jgi:hypothetical protein
MSAMNGSAVHAVKRRGRRAFTPAEDVWLIAAVQAGLTRVEIGQRLDRDHSSIVHRMRLLRREGHDLPAGDPANRRGRTFVPSHVANAVPERSQRKRRPCMCCGKPFDSAGAHNRLCNTCRRGSHSVFDVAARIGR